MCLCVGLGGGGGLWNAAIEQYDTDTVPLTSPTRRLNPSLLRNALPSPGNLDSFNPKHAFYHLQHLPPTPCKHFTGKREVAPAQSCPLQLQHEAGFNYRAKLSDNVSPHVITLAAQKEVEELAYPAWWRPCCHHSLLRLPSWGCHRVLMGPWKITPTENASANKVHEVSCRSL